MNNWSAARHTRNERPIHWHTGIHFLNRSLFSFSLAFLLFLFDVQFLSAFFGHSMMISRMKLWVSIKHLRICWCSRRSRQQSWNDERKNSLAFHRPHCFYCYCRLPSTKHGQKHTQWKRTIECNYPRSPSNFKDKTRMDIPFHSFPLARSMADWLVGWSPGWLISFVSFHCAPHTQEQQASA